MTRALVALLAICGPVGAGAQIASFKHVIVIVQENRTPDNLFQGLCAPPWGASSSCSAKPSPTQYNIQTSRWLDRTSPGGTIEPMPVLLAGPMEQQYDLGHSHRDFLAMCHLAGTSCQMDGAAAIRCGPTRPPCVGHPQFKFVDNSTGTLNPYLQMVKQYGWANYMFQTNQGPSFPAHQFLFGGTSARTAPDDAKAIFASENMARTGIGGTFAAAGCAAKDGPGGTAVALIKPPGVENEFVYPCFEHQTMADVLPPGVDWRYYSPIPGSIWTAPNAIQHICMASGPGGKCTGPEWQKNVDLRPSGVLRDIAACSLRSISWVIPTGHNSDHAHDNDGGGPSWVAAIVNAIGQSATCDGNAGYWTNTAIFITWDDWGGWYDHEPPTILAGDQGDYQYGFRVPLIAISAYTRPGYVNNGRHDFGSILRFAQQNFGVREGVLGFADLRALTNLTDFFNLGVAPRAFQMIHAEKSAQFFLTDRRRPTAPDKY